MKITFQVTFVSKNPAVYGGFARLEKDLPFAPTMEMDFEHERFDEPSRKPTSISFNLEDDSFFVTLGDIECATLAECEKARGYFADDGWDTSAD